MATNRRAQTPKSNRSKKTSEYRPEKKIRNVNSPRALKHRGQGWSE